MIDYFALALTHGLILIALIRLVGKEEIDVDPQIEARRYRKKRAFGAQKDEGQQPDA